MRSSVTDVPLSGVAWRVTYRRRPGPRHTLVYLHGLGSTSEDFTPAAEYVPLDEYDLLAIDLPGCGGTESRRAVTVEAAAELVVQVLAVLDVRSCTLIGHSLGGLTALLVARSAGALVRGFLNVEGNLAPEDCFWSRTAASWRLEEAGSFFPWFEAAQRSCGKSGFDIFASQFRQRITEPIFIAYAHSIVHTSDNFPLLEWFTQLPVARGFVYGDENADLAYLPQLRREGVALYSIPGSNHFPLYSNPPAFLEVVLHFVSGYAGASPEGNALAPS